MANNRMWFVNKKSGDKVLIAKYYPSDGWYCYHEDLSRKIDELFHKNDHLGKAMWGHTDWVIEYDVEE